MFTEYEDII